MNTMQCNIIRVFTDGACKHNGKKNASAGIGVYFPSAEFQDLSQRLQGSLQTNQRAELTAILMAFQITQKYDGLLEIYTDSMYCINIINSWMEKWVTNNIIKANWDLILKIYNAAAGRRFRLLHVKGHQKLQEDYSLCLYQDFLIYGNIKADKLATSIIP